MSIICTNDVEILAVCLHHPEAMFQCSRHLQITPEVDVFVPSYLPSQDVYLTKDTKKEDWNTALNPHKEKGTHEQQPNITKITKSVNTDDVATSTFLPNNNLGDSSQQPFG